jgi:hypothetical protein
LAACVLSALFIFAAIGSGLDRHSQKSNRWAARVPHVFAVQALEILGEARLKAGDGAGAASLARELLAKSPVEPTSAALLGAGYFAMGKADDADRVFRVAGQMGWRVPYTQIYWMGRALEVGDYAVASERLDAVLRQQPQLLRERTVMDPIERDPRGRAAMVERLVNRPNWLTWYAKQADNIPADVMLLRAEVLMRVGQRGVRVACPDIAIAVRQLVAVKAQKAAGDLWQIHCPNRAVNGLADGNFNKANLEKILTPFEWDFTGSSSLDLRLVAAGDAGRDSGDGAGKTLRISSTARMPQIVASQLVMLAPGKYRLSWVSATNTAQKVNLAVALGCSPDLHDWSAANFDPANKRWQAEILADNSCAAHWLSLVVVPQGEVYADTPAAELAIGDLALAPI